MPWARGKLRAVTVYVAKGLPWETARRRGEAQLRQLYGRLPDYRGFTYNKATGRAVFT